MENVLPLIFFLIFMLAGVVGVIFPILPGGILLSWMGYFIFGLLTKFQAVSLSSAIVFLGLAIVISIFDFLIPLLGAKKYRASNRGILGAFLGSIFGVMFFNILGAIIGPLVGAAIGEVSAKKEPEAIAKTVFGVLVGFLAGAIVKIIFIFIIAGFLFAKAF
jgi:uncharacterized protein